MFGITIDNAVLSGKLMDV